MLPLQYLAFPPPLPYSHCVCRSLPPCADCAWRSAGAGTDGGAVAVAALCD